MKRITLAAAFLFISALSACDLCQDDAGAPVPCREQCQNDAGAFVDCCRDDSGALVACTQDT